MYKAHTHTCTRTRTRTRTRICTRTRIRTHTHTHTQTHTRPPPPRSPAGCVCATHCGGCPVEPLRARGAALRSAAQRADMSANKNKTKQQMAGAAATAPSRRGSSRRRAPAISRPSPRLRLRRLICTGTGARPVHICAGTHRGPAAATSALHLVGRLGPAGWRAHARLGRVAAGCGRGAARQRKHGGHDVQLGAGVCAPALSA
jgi:hypothetical protein